MDTEKSKQNRSIRKVLNGCVAAINVALLIIMVLFLVLVKHLDDSMDLGSGYRYSYDYPQGIVKKTSSSGVFDVILTCRASSFEYDDNFLILRASPLNDDSPDSINYYIISKETGVPECFTDSLAFVDALIEKEIPLRLKEQ